ncbi:MAG: zinc-dependent alcohol dehydrogenase family protein [Sedimentisphaerales bacterium]|nr:zinc-dependent alcohol dehydrogenase family protein [Sedimentisphaerales bacterium]
MRAMVITEYGKPEVFHEKDMPAPGLQPGHVLIKIAASSVNPIDGKIRRGEVPINPPFPAILGMDVAGVIEQVADDVGEFRPGDEVYGCAGGAGSYQGALAEYMLADARLLAPKPKSLSFAEAAVLPLVGITAWEALIEHAHIQPGWKVLIHGGTGGVGHIAVQIAKAKGATVYATCGSPEKADFVRGLGADGVINYRTETVEDYVKQYTDGEGFDVAFDTPGGEVLSQAIAATRYNGHVLVINGRVTIDLKPVYSRGLSLHTTFMLIPLLYNKDRRRHGAILRQIARWVDEGQIRPLIDPRRFSITEIAEAHKLLESHSATGKISVSW